MIKNGVTRTVFIFKNFVIKIPTLKTHSNFLEGCIANWKERKYTKAFECIPNHDFALSIAPSWYCFPFGLLLIQAKVNKLDRELQEEEYKKFSDYKMDMNKNNFGYYKGRIVSVDYN